MSEKKTQREKQQTPERARVREDWSPAPRLAGKSVQAQAPWPPPSLHCQPTHWTQLLTVFCKSSTLGYLKLATTSPVFKLNSSSLLCPCLSLGLSIAQAPTGESSSAHIHPHLGQGDPFKVSNGLESTVTFSYLTHLLLFLFQPLKSGTVFVFLAKVPELERSGCCFSTSNKPHLEDVVLSSKWTDWECTIGTRLYYTMPSEFSSSQF